MSVSVSTSTYGQGQAEWWELVVIVESHTYIYNGVVVGA